MLLFVIFPFLLAKLKKYKLTPVFRMPDLYPVFCVEAVHLFFQISFYFGETRFVKYSNLIQNLFLLVLLLPILRQRLYYPSILGAGLTIAGTALNKIVIRANGGKMPVYPTLSKLTGFVSDGQLSGSVDSLHILMTRDTKLNFFADYIDLGFSILSPGDVLIHTFNAIIIYYTIKSRNNKVS